MPLYLLLVPSRPTRRRGSSPQVARTDPVTGTGADELVGAGEPAVDREARLCAEVDLAHGDGRDGELDCAPGLVA